jgi:hypothetical protein
MPTEFFAEIPMKIKKFFTLDANRVKISRSVREVHAMTKKLFTEKSARRNYSILENSVNPVSNFPRLRD